jgi:hypothetical protein
MKRRTVRYDPSDPAEVKRALRDVVTDADDAGLRVSLGVARSYFKVTSTRVPRRRDAGRGQRTSDLWAPGGKLREADNRRKAERAG